MAGMKLPFLPTKPKLPQAALDQLNSIVETYHLLRPASSVQTSADAEITRIGALLSEHPDQIWWTDIALAELSVVSLLDAEQLRARLISWRRRLRDVLGDVRYNDYLATATDLSTERDPEAFRADLSECIRAVYYFYGSYGVSALSRTRVTESLIKAAAMIIGAEAVVLLISWFAFRTPTINVYSWQIIVTVAVAASIAAVLGSIVSVQRRLQDPSVSVDPFYRYIQTDADWFGTAVISPLFASIFGVILYGLIVSKLLVTSIVNFLSSLPEAQMPKDIAGWAAGAIPRGPTDYAAILIFAFVSGFAEQLIPDALTRLASRALSDVSAAEPPIRTVAAPSSENATGPTSDPAAGGPDVVPPSPAKSVGATTLQSTNALQATSEAAALGQDPMLASNASAQNLSTGVA